MPPKVLIFRHATHSCIKSTHYTRGCQLCAWCLRVLLHTPLPVLLGATITRSWHPHLGSHEILCYPRWWHQLSQAKELQGHHSPGKFGGHGIKQSKIVDWKGNILDYTISNCSERSTFLNVPPLKILLIYSKRNFKVEKEHKRLYNVPVVYTWDHLYMEEKIMSPCQWPEVVPSRFLHPAIMNVVNIT